MVTWQSKEFHVLHAAAVLKSRCRYSGLRSPAAALCHRCPPDPQGPALRQLYSVWHSVSLALFLLSSCFPSHWSLVLLLSIVSPGLLLVIDCFTQHTFSASYGTFPFHQLRLVPSWFTCCLDVSPDSYRILQSSRAFVCLVSVSVDEPTWRLSALSSLCILAPKVFFFFSCFLTGKLSLFVQVSHPHWPLPFSLQVILQKECGLRKLMWNQHWTLLTVAIKICRLKTFFTSSPLN